MEEDKRLNQHNIWTYKFVGTADADKLEYILLDIEIEKLLPNNILKPALETIREKIQDKSRIRLFYSKEFNSFILEPF